MFLSLLLDVLFGPWASSRPGAGCAKLVLLQLTVFPGNFCEVAVVLRGLQQQHLSWEVRGTRFGGQNAFFFLQEERRMFFFDMSETQ